ncbi:hypothetical protein DU002_11510 [Corallincola holothuriorum]|uniref:Aminoglycoside phosphotransferase domain-containing protein n=1 Tax=Corallincola holothuriorum TaxID=2282215 RepID=A0A368NGE3_9GAMM|nr:phosphotransferase [Corallincola holothuriorum]RCU49538.1 hypothetical protein DU002_11510 [Corallincola holothuriorum]
MPYEPVQGRLHYILEKYKLEPLGDITISFCSMANEMFSFDTEQGRFYLKNCLKNNSPERIALEIDFSQHLQTNQMPCPEVVPAANGENTVCYNGFVFLMTRVFEGSTPQWNDTLQPWHVSETMRGLGSFHRAAATFPVERDSDRIKSFQFDRQLAWLDSLELKLNSAKTKTSVKEALALLPRLRAVITEIRPEVENKLLPNCQVQMIHGDFHCFNLFFKNEKITGCCDFDFIRRDLVLFDIWWCINSIIDAFYIQKTWRDKVKNPDFQPGTEAMQAPINIAVKECITLYRQTANLTDQELAFLPLMPALLLLNNMQFFEPDNSDEECAEHVQWLTYLLDGVKQHRKQLRQAVVALLKTTADAAHD